MSHVKLSAQANLDLVRLYEFLAQYDVATADRAIDSIIASLDILEKMPQGCQLHLKNLGQSMSPSSWNTASARV